jgi:hypothetical protein
VVIDASVAEVVVVDTVVVFPRPVDAASSAEDTSSSAPFRLKSDSAEDFVRRWELQEDSA